MIEQNLRTKEKGPAFRRGHLALLPGGSIQSVVLLAALLLAGLVALAHRIVLLLLSGFLAAALLPWLLTRALLAGALVLLARILVLLLRHGGKTPLLDVSRR
ncbi:hypothetical protein HYH07_12045 [Bradyrhizobium sp. BR 10261]|nr:hypothetical protein [Bradyrhizobium sp. BR 10261]